MEFENLEPIEVNFERAANAHLTFSLSTFKEATALSSLLKLMDEVEEVAKEIIEPESYCLAEEYADCFLCLIDSAARSNLFMAEIVKAMAEKVVKNRSRKWIKNDNDTYSHVKDLEVNNDYPSIAAQPDQNIPPAPKAPEKKGYQNAIHQEKLPPLRQSPQNLQHNAMSPSKNGLP